MKGIRAILGTVLAFVGLVVTARAAEISPELAQQAVDAWLKRGQPVQGRTESAKAVVDPETGARINVVTLKGGGFVITAGDDLRGPVMAFSREGEFDVDLKNPLWVMVKGDARIAPAETNAGPSRVASAKTTRTETQVAWDKLLGRGDGPQHAAPVNAPAGSLVYRQPMIETMWDQGFHNGYSEKTGLPCYNYYTPMTTPRKSVARSSVRSELTANAGLEDGDSRRTLCGCVATAGAQVMYYHQYPQRAECKSFTCHLVDSIGPNQITLNTGTEAYNWTAMEKNPYENPPGETARAAIGRLTADVAIACEATFGVDETGAVTEKLRDRFCDVFQYKSAYFFPGMDVQNLEAFRRNILANLDAKCPVVMSIRGTGGHAVVADGYAENSESSCGYYLHVNMGWRGRHSAWYVPPTFYCTSDNNYSAIDGFIGNIFPFQSGQIVSGSVVSSMDAIPLMGASVSLKQGRQIIAGPVLTDENGIYALIAPAGSYTVSVSCGAESSSYPVTLSVGSNVLMDLPLAVLDKVTPPVATTPQVYYESREMTIACATPGAEIYYTVDGTIPTMGSLKYDRPFKIYFNTDLKIRAFKSGMLASDMVTYEIKGFPIPCHADMFANAIGVAEARGKLRLSNVGATHETGEPTYGGNNSIWISFVAPEDGNYRFSVLPERVSGTGSFGAYAGVYQGTAVSALRMITGYAVTSESGPVPTKFKFAAVKGEVYKIALETPTGSFGIFNVTWEKCDVVDIAQSAIDVGSEAKRHKLVVKSTSTWNVIDHSDWLSVVKSSGKDGEELEWSVPANASWDVRQGLIYLKSGDSDVVTLTIRQMGSGWHASRDEAEAAAARSGKRIIMVYGHDGCSNTTTARQLLSTDAGAYAAADEGYVRWYCNSYGSSRSEAAPYTTGLGSFTLPCIAIIDASDMSKYLTRTTGPQSASGLTSLLSRAKKIPVLVASQGTSPESVTLSWPAVPGATQYVVYRGSSAGYLSVLQSGVTALSYVDVTAAEGEKYFYAVAAVVGGTTGDRCQPTEGYRQLAAPAVAVGKSTNEYYPYAPSLSWTSVAGAKYYFVTRRYEDGAEYTNRLTTTSWLDTGYVAGRRVTYTVVAARDSSWDSNLRNYVPVDPSRASAVASHLEGASISFDPDNGDTYMPRYSYDLGETATWLYTPTRDGYRFDGWYTARTGGTRVTAPLTVSERYTTLYAHWTPYAYRVDLVAPEAIYERTPLYLVATVTNLTSGVKCVTNEASWRVVSGTAAAFDSDGALVPVAVSGKITVEGKVNYWGVEAVRRATIEVVRESDILGLIVEGSDKFDSLYEDSASYGAFLTSADNRRFRVTPSWAVTCPNASVCRISSSGELTVDSSQLVSTARVTAAYGKWTASRDTVVHGYNISFADWSHAVMANGSVVWPGKEVVLTPGKVRWMRHDGEVVAKRGDISGLRFSHYVYNAGRSFSGNGLRFVVPNDLCDDNRELEVYLYCYSERTERCVILLSLRFNFFTAKPPLMSVQFDAGAGKVSPSTMSFAAGFPYLQLPYAERTGYNCSWYTAKTGGTLVTAASNCLSSITKLYAQWQSIYYCITFDANGGTGSTGRWGCYYDQSFTLPKNRFTKENDVFLGWATAPNGPVVYADGQTVKNLTANAYEDAILYAVWKSTAPAAKTYTVRFHTTYGTDMTKDQSFTVGVAQQLYWKDSQLGWANPAGKTFLGWSTSAGSGLVKYANGEKVKDLTTVGKTVDLYAVWYDAKTDYVVRFHRNASGTDTMAAQQRLKAGVSTSLAWKDSGLGWTAAPAGKTFLGWGTSADATVAKWANGENVKDLAAAGKIVDLHAVWRPSNTYVVTFHRNVPGDTTTASQWISRGVSTSLAWKDSQLGWAPAGYTFLGWAESADGAIKYANGAKVTDLAAAGGTKHLYARWKANAYTVRFHYNYGTDRTADQAFAYGTEQALRWLDSGLKWEHPEGAVFLGWAESPNGAKKYANGAKVKNLTAASGGIVHLYAKWNLITVRFHKNAGGTDVTATQTFRPGVAQNLTWKDSGLKWANPAGKVFVGWGTAANAAFAAYANGAKVTDPAPVGNTLDLYAVWAAADSYIVKFYRNYTSTDATVAYQGVARTTATALVWKDSQLGWANPSGRTFLGWAKTRTATAGTYANGAKVTGLGAKGGTVALYAVWSAPAKSAKRESASSPLQGGTASVGNDETSPVLWLPDYICGIFADGSGTFDLLIGEFAEDGVAEAFFAATTEDGFWTEECEAMVVDETLLLTFEDAAPLVICYDEREGCYKSNATLALPLPSVGSAW